MLKVLPSRTSTLAGWICPGSSGLMVSVPWSSSCRMVWSDKIMAVALLVSSFRASGPGRGGAAPLPP